MDKGNVEIVSYKVDQVDDTDVGPTRQDTDRQWMQLARVRGWLHKL